MTIAYDGTDFCGWQKQTPYEDSVPEGLSLGAVVTEQKCDVAVVADVGDGAAIAIVRERIVLRTVQEVVERAVREVVREPIVLMGASRTDSGVHARGQVGAFTCANGETRGIGWPAERGTLGLVKAINEAAALEPSEKERLVQRATQRLHAGFRDTEAARASESHTASCHSRGPGEAVRISSRRSRTQSPRRGRA